MPMPNKVVSLVAGVLATMMLSSASSVLAQKPAGLPGNYPNKLVKVIVGGAPGGGGDIMGRLVAKNMADAWGHTFIVENKVSVLGSAFALEDLSKQPADGYAMMLVAGSTYIGATAVHMVPKDPLKAIDPIAQLNAQPYLLIATTSLPVKTVPELVAYAKKNPGALNYASSGIGSSAHLASEYLKHAFGLDIVHVPYKGLGAAYVDLLAGRTQISFGTTVSAVPYAQKGSLKILGTTTPKRLSQLPDVPSLAEFIPGFDFVSFFGVVGPAGMPKPVVNALNKQINDILANPDVIKRLESDGSLIVRTTPEGFQKTLENWVNRIQQLVKDTKIDLKDAVN